MSLTLLEVDYNWVEKTDDPKKLKAGLKLLLEDGGYFPDLEKAIKNKILSITGVKNNISVEDIEKERNDFLNWERDITKIDTSLKEKDNVNDFQRKKDAEKLKIIGNEFMKTKNYKEALEKYTESINMNSKEPSTYCNRALTYFKLNQYRESILDCDKTIELSKTYTKAYYRRAACYVELKEFDLAWNDLCALHKDLSDNAEIINEINSAKSKWRSHVGESKWAEIEKSLNDPTKPKIEKLNQETGFKKIKIIEVNEEEEESKQKQGKKIQDEPIKIDKEEILEPINLNKHNPKITEITDPEKIKQLKNKNTYTNSNINQNTATNQTEVKEQKSNQQPKKKEVKYDEQNVNKAFVIATEDLDFSFYPKNYSGFQQAYSSFINNPKKFFEFLKYFGAAEFSKCFEKNELSMDLLLLIILSLSECKESIISSQSNYQLGLDFLIVIPKTKSFIIKKMMLKTKKKLFEVVLEIYKNETSIDVEKLYFN